MPPQAKNSVVSAPPVAGASNVEHFGSFLSNNRAFLKEKYEQYFGTPFPITKLVTKQNSQLVLRFIYDVFGFGKYESDEKMNKTLKKGLMENVESFVKKTSSQKPKGSNDANFNEQEAVRMLQFCIENNEMFVVHYDKKTGEGQKEDQITRPKTPEDDLQQPPHQNEQQAESQDPMPEENEFPTNESQLSPREIQPINDSKLDKPLSSSRATEKLGTPKIKPTEHYQVSSPLEEQIESPNEFTGATHRSQSSVKPHFQKQCSQIFDFYCKQHQSISPSTTFDKISQSCRTMNLGKFVAFFNAAHLVSQKLTKFDIKAIFVRIAGGKKQIGAEDFSSIIAELRSTDEKVAEKLGIIGEGPQSMVQLREKLRYFNAPFNTKDEPFRENETNASARHFVPKITSHSGKLRQDLQEDIRQRKSLSIRPSSINRSTSTAVPNQESSTHRKSQDGYLRRFSQDMSINKPQYTVSASPKRIIQLQPLPSTTNPSINSDQSWNTSSPSKSLASNIGLPAARPFQVPSHLTAFPATSSNSNTKSSIANADYHFLLSLVTPEQDDSQFLPQYLLPNRGVIKGIGPLRPFGSNGNTTTTQIEAYRPSLRQQVLPDINRKIKELGTSRF